MTYPASENKNTERPTTVIEAACSKDILIGFIAMTSADCRLLRLVIRTLSPAIQRKKRRAEIRQTYDLSMPQKTIGIEIALPSSTWL